MENLSKLVHLTLEIRTSGTTEDSEYRALAERFAEAAPTLQQLVIGLSHTSTSVWTIDHPDQDDPATFELKALTMVEADEQDIYHDPALEQANLFAQAGLIAGVN